MAGKGDEKSESGKGNNGLPPSLTPPKHVTFMQHAIAAANMAVGTTSPNPPVGCVIVKDDIILAAAHTAPGGRPHAETIALSEAGNAACGATVYVTLEPCSHLGKTPPCAEALINAGVKTVIIANTDPFIKVNGKGIKMLQEAGIEVITNICTNESAYLYDGFFSVQNKGRPFITLKTATSLDGKIALKDGSSRWITGEESRRNVHLMRSRNDAIITGIGTIIADDPSLTCRLPGMELLSPIRVVLDGNLNLPPSCKLAKTAKITPCWVITLADTITQHLDKAKQLESLGIKILVVNKASNGKICLEDTMFQLAKNGINTAMIEAGSTINTAALQLGLVDVISWFIAPIIIGNDGIPAFKDLSMQNLIDTKQFELISSSRLECDTKLQLNKMKIVKNCDN